MSTPSIFRTRILPIAAGCAAAMALSMAGATQEADQDEAATTPAGLPVVLENGILVSEGNSAPVLHALNVNGIYYINDKPSGGWVTRGNALCLVTIKGKVNCTDLPENIAAGSSWNTDRDDGTSTSFALPGGAAATEGDDDEG